MGRGTPLRLGIGVGRSGERGRGAHGSEGRNRGARPGCSTRCRLGFSMELLVSSAFASLCLLFRRRPWLLLSLAQLRWQPPPPPNCGGGGNPDSSSSAFVETEAEVAERALTWAVSRDGRVPAVCDPVLAARHRQCSLRLLAQLVRQLDVARVG